MMDVRVGDGQGQYPKPEVMQSGRYLARVERAKQLVHKGTGSSQLVVDLMVKDGHGVKRPVSLWFTWMRKDGTRVRIPCQQIATLAVALGLGEQFEEADMAGRMAVVTLDYVQEGNWRPKNELVDAEPVMVGQNLGHDGRLLPPGDGDAAVQPDGSFATGTPVDPQSGQPVGSDDDLPFATCGYAGTRSRRSPLASVPRVAW